MAINIHLVRPGIFSDFGAGRDLAAAVIRANMAFEQISAIDEQWHLDVHEGRVPYDPADEEWLLAAYQGWLREAEALERAGCEVEELRRNVREVRGLLTPDPEFFAGDRLDEMAARAIEEHRAGLTEEFHD